ncbi:MAG: O-antigen ligase family protein [Candidatus Paceibacterota bacterium]
MLKQIAKVLVAMSLATPLVFTRNLYFPFISGKALVFRTLIILALACYALHIYRSENRKAELAHIKKTFKNPLVIALTAFAAIFVVAALAGANPIQSFWSNFERSEGGLQILHYYTYFLLLATLFTKKKDAELLMGITIAAAAISGVYGMLQWLVVSGGGSFSSLAVFFRELIVGNDLRISGTLGNASYLAAYSLFSLSFIGYFFSKAKSMKGKILLTMLGLFQLLTLVRTGTKGAMLGLLAGLILWFALNAFRKGANKNVRLIASILLVVSVGSIVVFFQTSQSSFWQNIPLAGRFFQLEKAVADFQPRVWSWESAIAGTLEKPTLGWGAENYPFVFDKYYNPKHLGRESFFDRTHNLYLEQAVSGGVLLLAALLAVLFFAFREAAKKKNSQWKFISLALILGYMVQAFFLFDVLVIYLSFYLLLALLLNKELDTEGIELSFSSGQKKTLYALFAALALNFLVLQPAVAKSQIAKTGTHSEFISFILIFLATFVATRSLTKESSAYTKGSKQQIVGAVTLILALALIYKTIFLPLQKNRYMVQAVARPAITDKIEAIENALAVHSNVGKEETVIIYSNIASQVMGEIRNRDEAVPLGTYAEVVDRANEVFNTEKDNLSGLRSYYVNGALNFKAGVVLQNTDYFERGKNLFNHALEVSPTRIEFVTLLMEAARAERDEEAYNKLDALFSQLRPDLDRTAFVLDYNN